MTDRRREPLDISGAAFWIGLFAALILTTGEPDLLDAIVARIMR